MRSTLFATLALSVTDLVVSDACLSFCESQLSVQECRGKPYCRSTKKCKNLYWTSAEKESICMSTSKKECDKTHPVTCQDAGVVEEESPVVLCGPTTPFAFMKRPKCGCGKPH
jgi:hypothetical protein